MPLSSGSDAETVLDEDSPLSPCVWTVTAAAHAAENRRQSTAALSTPNEPSTQHAQETNSRLDRSLQIPRRELQLSPASQLNVLSQISELADAQSQQTAAAPRCSNVWAPATGTSKRKKNSPPVASTRSKAKKQKQAQKQPTRSQAERLAADMLDWETCSEGELFTLDADDEEDQWVYDDISDSDFEA